MSSNAVRPWSPVASPPKAPGATESSTLSVLGRPWTHWAVVGIAGAMVLSIATESLRAALREGPHLAAPAVLGLLAALWTVRRAATGFRCCGALSEARWLPGVLLTAPVLFQVPLVLSVQTRPASDWAVYRESADHLLGTGEYRSTVSGGLQFRAHKPPGMALYLAAVQAVFGRGTIAPQLVNVLLVIAGNTMFWIICRRQLPRATALLATAVFTCWPSRNCSVALLGYDAIGSLIMVCFWYWISARPFGGWTALPAGVLAGIGSLIRPTLLLLPLTCLLVPDRPPGRWREGLRFWGLLLLGTAISLAPWAWRNQQVLGRPIITGTQGGMSIYRGFHPVAGRYYTNVGWDELRTAGNDDELTMSRLGFRKGVSFVLADPAAALWRMARKCHRLLESDHEVAGFALDTPSGPLPGWATVWLRRALCGVSDLWYAWLSGCTLIAATVVLRRPPAQEPDGRWPLLALGGLFAACAVFESQPRYFVMYQCFWAFTAAVAWRSAVDTEATVASRERHRPGGGRAIFGPGSQMPASAVQSDADWPI